MEHYRLRKYRSAEVWHRVRIAYEEGEPAPAVALRFDVGLANLRKKASREGWTRAALARRADPPPDAAAPDTAPRDPAPEPVDPRTALARARQQAATLLAAGRPAEATAMLKAVEALTRVLEAEPPPAAEPDTDPDETYHERQRRLEREDYSVLRLIERRARVLAVNMLMEQCSVEAVHSLACFHWRRDNLGPATAAADYHSARNNSWASRYWDENGQLYPMNPTAPEDVERRQIQFQSFDEAIERVRHADQTEGLPPNEPDDPWRPMPDERYR